MSGNAPSSDKGKNKEIVDEKPAKNKVGRPRVTAEDMEGFMLSHFDLYERIRGGVSKPAEGTSGALFNRVALAFIGNFGWNDPWPKVKEEPEDGVEGGEKKSGEEGGEKKAGEKSGEEGGEKKAGEKSGEKKAGEKSGEDVEQKSEEKSGEQSGEQQVVEILSAADVQKAIADARKLVQLKGVAEVDQAAVAEAQRRDDLCTKVRAKVKYTLEYEHRCRRDAGTLKYPPKKKGGPKSAGVAASSAGAGEQSGSGSGSGEINKQVGVRTQTGADILKMFLAKAPKRTQAHICWMEGLEGDEEAEFEAAVDKRLDLDSEMAKSQGRSPPPRQGVRHAEASERYKLLSDERKREVRDEVEADHQEALAGWRSRQSVEPESPEDAVEFLEAARDLLADLADFVAARGSAACVWYTCGPKGKAYCSNATVEVKDHTTTHWKDEVPASYHQVGLSIAAHAKTINDLRWGSLVQNLGPRTPGPEVEDDEPTAAADSGSTHMPPTGAIPDSAPEPTNPDSPSLPPTSTSTNTDPAPIKPPRVAPEPTNPDSPPLPPTSTSTNTDPAPIKPPRVRPTPVRHSRIAQPQGAGEKPSNNADALPTAVASKPNAAKPATVASELRAPSRPVADGELGVGETEGADVEVQAAAGSAGEDTTEANETASVFAFEMHDALDGYAAHADEYEKSLELELQKLTLRKAWVEKTKTGDFFRDLKKKVAGKVDVGLACKVGLAYLALENSNAPDDRFLMRENENGRLLPEYVVGFMRSPRNGTARWHKRSLDQNKKRTSAMIDFDVAETLPHQWAMLQPDERRDDAGKIIAPARASLTWPPNTICAGEEGIRILVVTLLSWGSCVEGGNRGEVEEWTRTAVDVAAVLDIVAAKQGPASGTIKATEGRKKMPSLKQREITGR
ncbi:hypothetical protein PENSPDRAFT_695081 [Peniophora sp. CONT]|nr:hypothetical protein PENSPDRAFT_695081 [Peniophora sp. CONT]